MATERTGSFGPYYTGSGLIDEQIKANVLYIGKYLLDKGWSLQAIAGLCGNIESECHFNPGGKEIGGSGYGLIQWTPGTIHSEWCAEHGYADATTMDANLAHIVWEAENNESWYKRDNYTESYSEFITSTKSPDYLACAFAWNRERSAITLWGFHRGIKGDIAINDNRYHVLPPHIGRSYCKKKNYDSSCENTCEAYKYCYKNKFGEARTNQQVLKNKQDTKDTRGKQGKKWFNFLWKNLYARLDENDTSVLTNRYWISGVSPEGRAKGGLNYNYAVEQWPTTYYDEEKEKWIPRAMKGALDADWNRISGTYTTLPNCTSWAWGRAYEIMGEEPLRFSGDAGNWWNNYTKEELEVAGYSKSQIPTYGAIACWQDLKDPTSMGHVAIVEDIDEDGNITISESGYQTWDLRPSYFNVQKRIAGGDYTLRDGTTYKFVGYIGLPKYGLVESAPTIESFEVIEEKTEEASFKVCIIENISAISHVYYTLDTGESNDLPIIAGTNIFTVKNLVPNTNYVITLTAESGSAAASASISFKTKQDYPDPVKNISIKSASTKNTEFEIFEVSVEGPDRWGYWQRIGNAYGYRLFPVKNCKLLDSLDLEARNNIQIIPKDVKIAHGENFQVGISTWVTDNSREKVFAQPGKDFPVCSDAILLKDISEISDTWFILENGKKSKTQPYIRVGVSDTFKPLNIFKL